MAPVGGPFGGGIALALLGDRMDQHRPGRALLDRAQQRQKLVQIMPIDGADIGKAQFLKHRPADGHALQHFLGPARAHLDRLRQEAHGALGHGLQLLKRAFGVKPRQIAGQRAGGRRNRHLVIVQDHEQPLAQMAGIVQRLKRHASRHRAIADHGNRIARIAAQLARHGEPQSRADRGRAVPGPERVIGAFRPLGEARQAPARAQSADAVAPPGQDFVRIALVPDVPNDLVARRVKDGMQRHGQFHHAQTRAQMAAGHRNRADGFGAQFIGQLAQFPVGKRLQVGWQVYPVKHRGLGQVMAHGASLSGAFSFGGR